MQDIVEKASTLIEALPYIKTFRGREFLIKYGGAAMVNDEIRANVLQDLVFMSYIGIRPVLVHGGGKEITENLKKKGIETRFVDGLRVTSKEAMAVVVETLAEINRKIVEDINHFGRQAVGLSGHDANIIQVVKREASEDVGYVGKVVNVNYEPIRMLTEKGIIPVIFGVGRGAEGQYYNVNADEAASKIAAAMRVQKMMMLTNVHGILRDATNPDTLISSLHTQDVQELIQQGIISGGMIPKVQAGLTALEGGVKKVHIIDGRIQHSMLLEIFTDKGIGTEIIQ